MGRLGRKDRPETKGALVTDRLQARVAVFLVLYQGRRVLILKRKNTLHYPDRYSIPAGHVETGETPLAAVVRETKEEVGVDVTGHVKFCGVAYRQDFGRAYVDFIFEANWWDARWDSQSRCPEPFNAEPEKVDDVHWCLWDQLPATFVPHTAKMIDSWAGKTRYSHWPP